MAGIDRRKLLRAGAAGGFGAAAAASVAAPAIAQSAPEIRWRMTSSFSKSFDILYGTAEVFSAALAEMTDKKFQVQVFPPPDIVPPFGAADAVTNATVEMAHTASYYYWGKDPAFAFGTAVPFGLNARQQNAWLTEAGGLDLLNKFYSTYKIMALPGGNTGAQMGGWFRKEINSVADLKGLKMRIAGFAGAVMEKLGAVPSQVPGGEIYSSLERGQIDAAEWVGPYDDEKQGFYKVAKNYYYPGWWEGGAMLLFFVNTDKYAALPRSYQVAMKGAAAIANTTMLARYDVANPIALRKLDAGGAVLKQFSEGVLDACFDAANGVYAEISAKNANFKTLYESTKAFRGEAYLWQQVADFGFDYYMMIQQRNKKL